MLKREIILISLFIVLLIGEVSAFGVSPGKTIVFFNGGTLQENLEVSLKNDHDFNVTGELYLRSFGFPLEYINFQSVNVTFLPNERKSINFTINIPRKLDAPGDHRFDFVARELFPKKEEGSIFSVSIAVGSIFLVRVPYEGYFLNARLEAKGSTVGEYVPFTLTLENLGTLPINNIEGTLEIFDNSSKKVGEVPFKYDLPTNSVENLDLEWNSVENSYGNYHAKATLNFNGKSIVAETDFKLGDIHISITDYDKSIVSGEINKFRVNIKSDWGNPIEDVYVMLSINPGISPQVFKSENFNLNPWESKEVIIYVDAEKIKGGKYPTMLEISYDGIYTQEEFDLRVKPFDYNPILIGVGIFIVVFLLGYFFIIKRRKKKHERNK